MAKKFECKVTRTDTYEGTIVVEADTEEQAGVMAEEQANALDSDSWDFQGTDYSVDEIIEVDEGEEEGDGA